MAKLAQSASRSFLVYFNNTRTNHFLATAHPLFDYEGLGNEKSVKMVDAAQNLGRVLFRGYLAQRGPRMLGAGGGSTTRMTRESSAITCSPRS